MRAIHSIQNGSLEHVFLQLLPPAPSCSVAPQRRRRSYSPCPARPDRRNLSQNYIVCSRSAISAHRIWRDLERSCCCCSSNLERRTDRRMECSFVDLVVEQAVARARALSITLICVCLCVAASPLRRTPNKLLMMAPVAGHVRSGEEWKERLFDRSFMHSSPARHPPRRPR